MDTACLVTWQCAKYLQHISGVYGTDAVTMDRAQEVAQACMICGDEEYYREFLQS